MAAYCAAKFGVQGFMESLAGEVGGDGIRLGTIVPGSIMTGFGGRSADRKRDSGARYHQPPTARIQELLLWPN